MTTSAVIMRPMAKLTVIPRYRTDLKPQFGMGHEYFCPLIGQNCFTRNVFVRLSLEIGQIAGAKTRDSSSQPEPHRRDA